MEFRVLGRLEVISNGRALVVASARQRALLALLLINVGRALSPDRIIDELWGDDPPQSGAKAVVFHVSKLREALEPDRARGEPGAVLVTDPSGYRLDVDPEAIDSFRSERLAAAGRECLPDDPETAAHHLRAAVLLWRGDPYSDFTYEPFAQDEIRRLTEFHVRLLEDRIEADLTLGRHDTVIGELQVLVAEHPLRERLRGQLMLALYRGGRQAEALRVYQAGRRALGEELGIDPSPELQRLEDLVLRQDQELALVEMERPPPTPRNPYKGLRPFGEPDAPDFFGREALVDRLVARLSDVIGVGRILTLVGPSGSGKSSVVRAGVIPALRAGALTGSDRWLITVMYPGSRPWEELDAALLRIATHPPATSIDQLRRDREGLASALMRILPSDDSRLLLVIDQFEELFSLVKDREVRSCFLESLLTATSVEHSRLIVINTLRADFLDDALRHPEYGRRLPTGLELVTPLGSHELESAITNPARGVGTKFEPALAAAIASDVADQPGALPLLQYALTELFDRSEGPTLTARTYAKIGGVLDAVGRRAEEVYLDLDPQSREITRQLFLGLVTPREGTQPTAGRVRLSDLELLLGRQTSLSEVLDRFGSGRLLTFDRDPAGEPTVQIAHEALLTRWARLADWIEDQREGLWIRSRLHTAADEWQEANQSGGFLLTAGRLDLFETWAASADLPLSSTDRAFLEASVIERARAEAAAAARAEHEEKLERRAANRLRALVTVFAVAAVVAIILSLVVLGQRQTARREEAIASARELAAASIGTLRSDPELSVLLALQAGAATAPRGYIVEEALDALHLAMQESQIPYPQTDAAVAVRSGPEGRRGVFLLDPDGLMSHAANGSDRRLSYEECRTYLHQSPCPAEVEWGRGLDIYTEHGTIPVEQLASASLAGARVEVVADFDSDPGPVVTKFIDDSGIAVNWVTHDNSVGLAAELTAGNHPDVAVVSRPGVISSLADAGRLIDLSTILEPSHIGADLSSFGVEMGTPGDDVLFGVPWAVSVSSLVWYPVAEFEQAGYLPPSTWNGLIALSRQMVADGHTPWCIGVSEDGGSGAVATDWVEDLVLRTAGPTAYDQWVDHEVSFQHPIVHDALRRFGEIALREELVLGGSASITSIPRDLAAWPMLSQPPKCWLHRDGTESRSSLPLTGSVEIAAFLLPAVNPDFSDTVTGRIYTVTVLSDRPEVRRFVEYLLSSEVAAVLARTSGLSGLLPARPVDAQLYANERSREQDRLLRASLSAELFRVDASDLMPPEVGSGSFPEGLLTYMTWGEASLDQVLADIEETWP
jgi:DNA-binding SARP family transcriptional activator/ABC-type glycerol-3-phosphate transport system substrate-binding protein